MITVGNGKEIIGLARPSSIGFVQGIEIARRSGIENIHITSIQLLGERRDLVAILTQRSVETYLSIDVFDYFIQILEPFVCVLIVKIATHGHHDMIGGITECLKR